MRILQSSYLTSSPDYSKCPLPDRPEYAFIGRSNVGKSSLINMLCNKENLARISGSPGKTQLINHFSIESGGQTAGQDHPVDHWYLVDLPGYGFARVSHSMRKQWETMISDYLRKRKNLVNVFVLIDSRHLPQKIDLEFVDRLGEWQVPFCLVFTKADKVAQRIAHSHIRLFLDKMREHWQFLPMHFVTSAIRKSGREKMLQAIAEMNESFAGGE